MESSELPRVSRRRQLLRAWWHETLDKIPLRPLRLDGHAEVIVRASGRTSSMRWCVSSRSPRGPVPTPRAVRSRVESGSHSDRPRGRSVRCIPPPACGFPACRRAVPRCRSRSHGLLRSRPEPGRVRTSEGARRARAPALRSPHRATAPGAGRRAARFASAYAEGHAGRVRFSALPSRSSLVLWLSGSAPPRARIGCPGTRFRSWCLEAANRFPCCSRAPGSCSPRRCRCRPGLRQSVRAGRVPARSRRPRRVGRVLYRWRSFGARNAVARVPTRTAGRVLRTQVRDCYNLVPKMQYPSWTGQVPVSSLTPSFPPPST